MSEGRYVASALFKDNETRLLIPSKEVIIGGFLAGAAANLTQIYADDTGGEIGSGALQTLIRSVLTGPLLTLGVTKIRVKGKMVLPRTKGIGSVGQIIHLMGSENEKLSLEFTTDRFPGPIASILHDMIKITLESADLVYVVDDLMAVAPCILIDYDLYKIGKLRSAIVGELKFEVLNILGVTGLSKLGVTFLTALTGSAISNTISELSQPFKWMGTVIQQKKSRG